jgi:hypothetical protein
MNIRFLVTVAIISLGISSASLANEYINPASINLADVNSFLQVKIGGSTKATAKVPLTLMSFAGQNRVFQNGTDKYKVVSLNGTPGLDVTYNKVKLEKNKSGNTLNFDLTVKYDKGVNYGAHVVYVTLENEVTTGRVTAILMVTVI